MNVNMPRFHRLVSIPATITPSKGKNDPTPSEKRKKSWSLINSPLLTIWESISHVWICPELVILTNWLIVQKRDSWVKPGRHLWPSGGDKRFSSKVGRDSACNNCCCGPLPVYLWGGDREKQPAPQAPWRMFESEEILSTWLDMIGQLPSQNRSSTSNEVAAGFCSRSWRASVDMRMKAAK